MSSHVRGGATGLRTRGWLPRAKDDPGQQPARQLKTQSYNPKKLNSDNNPGAPEENTAPTDMLISAWWDPEQRNQLTDIHPHDPQEL